MENAGPYEAEEANEFPKCSTQSPLRLNMGEIWHEQIMPSCEYKIAMDNLGFVIATSLILVLRVIRIADFVNVHTIWQRLSLWLWLMGLEGPTLLVK